MLKKMTIVEAIKSDYLYCKNVFDVSIGALKLYGNVTDLLPTSSPNYTYKTIGTTTLKVVDSPIGCLMAVSMVGCLMNIVIEDSIETVICTDDTFKKLSPETQLFVIAHEFGHHENRDLFLYFGSRSVDREINADKYAMEQMSSPKAALRAFDEMVNVLPFCIKYVMLQEIKQRRAALKSYIQ